MRHAIYFAPAVEHPLWQAGSVWLGRDACDPRPGDVDGPFDQHLSAPWRYGFHATLKAPLRWAHGSTEATWREALHQLASRWHRFAMPALVVDRLDDFLALRPSEPVTASHPLRRLADDCVAALDPCRAPLTEAECKRWQRAGLGAHQQAQVRLHGYPHVFDDWRFHMTLSNPIASSDPPAFERLRRAAMDHFAPALALPLVCDAICWFVEPEPGAPLLLRERIGFA